MILVVITVEWILIEMHTFGSYTIGMVKRDVFYRLERGYLNPKVKARDLSTNRPLPWTFSVWFDKIELASFSKGYPWQRVALVS